MLWSKFFKKKDFVLPDWRSENLPAAVSAAQTMLLKTEQQMLFSIMRNYFTNSGTVVDAGCFLGGSTLALAHGLMANPKWQANARPAVIHSYDLFLIEPWTIGVYFPEGTPLDTSFESKYRENISQVSHLVDVKPGDITGFQAVPKNIELLFIDCAKHWTVSDYIVRNFFRELIAGHSIVIQQDYLYPQFTGWLHVTMEYFSEYFKIVDHTDYNSVAFHYHKEIPKRLLKDDVFQSLTLSEIAELGKAAAARFSGRAQREIVQNSQAQLQEMLLPLGWKK